MNNSTLLENEVVETPPETVVQSQTLTVNCIHCGKPWAKRGITNKLIFDIKLFSLNKIFIKYYK